MGVSVNYARRSIATIDSPEFVNITSISPLVSKCEVKVLYVGENRNRSFISKEVAAEMAQTLPGCPIVGYYIENKEDFGDHGDQVIIDGEGIKFKKLTKPYGFVAPDAKVWFQKFEDTDEFGNTVIREYLMTEGFLWTGQFEECQRVVDQGNPQSMELDEKTLKGHWSTNTNKGIDFFIINDAIFSKLCILGEDVEPCFEGSSVTAPDVSSNFSKDDNFMQSLFTMMETLKFTLSNKEGEQLMENQNTVVAEVENQDTTPIVEENFSAVQDKVNEETSVENQNITEEPSQDSVLADDTSFAKKDEKEDDKKDKKDKEDENKEDKKDEANNDDDEEDTKKKYELLVAAHEELQAKYSELETSYQALVEFKNQVEEKEKDDLIASFVMLSDEDKKEVIENKSKYSLREIKAELSMICVDKKVSFDLNKEEDNENELPLTYNLNSQETSTLPAWLQAVEDTRKRMK
jgi:hypothetical protein